MKTTTIEEACTIHARIGWQGLTKKEYLNDGDYYLVTGVDFERGHIAFENCYYVTKDRYEQDPHIQIGVNDILVTKDGTIGKVAIIESPIDKPATLNSGVFVVRPKDTYSLLPKYLMCVLQSNLFTRFIEEIKVGCTIAHLNQEKFLKFSFPIPSTDEQRKIIQIFDSISSLLFLRQTQIKMYDELIKARFVEMFGEGLADDGKYPLIPISEIGNVVSGATPKTSIDEYWDGDNLWITPAEISDDTFVVSDTVRKITDEGVKSCAVNLLPIGTVILSSRAPIGKVAIAGAPMYCNQGFKNIIPNGKIDSVYLYELLAMETEYLNSLGRGATFKEISKQIVENIRIKVPPIEIQRDFSIFVKQVDKSKVAIQKSLDETQLLFDSLMQKYFG